MRAAAALMLLLMAGCNRVENRFEVHAPGATSAELNLCGEVTQLDRSGEQFTGVRVIDCEGAGEIAVRYPDQPPVTCPVGYVTPGADQSFRFEVGNGQCS